MKKIILLVISLILVFNVSIYSVFARAGGGSSGGSSSEEHSSGSSSTSTSPKALHSNSRSDGSQDPLRMIIGNLTFCLVVLSPYIAINMKLKKSKLKNKNLMSKFEKLDSAWKYKDIEKQVIDAYFNIQNAWTKQDMKIAKPYITEDLYNNLNIKIEWMKVRNRKNILKKIKLIDPIPISVNDDEDNMKDNVWYYIEGSMIDYTIDTTTNKIIEGNKFKTRFVEYWKFVRNEKNKWVLSKILQENEKDKID